MREVGLGDANSVEYLTNARLRVSNRLASPVSDSQQIGLRQTLKKLIVGICKQLGSLIDHDINTAIYISEYNYTKHPLPSTPNPRPHPGPCISHPYTDSPSLSSS